MSRSDRLGGTSEGTGLPIYLLPGMTPHFPVYQKLLPRLPTAQVVPFLTPEPGETLACYAERMASGLSGPCLLGGVSFGGILAQEMCRFLKPAGCVVMASVRRPAELPPWLRIWRPLGHSVFCRLLQTAGRAADRWPRALRTRSTVRLSKLAGAPGAWHRWATAAVMNWRPAAVDTPMIHIHGDQDTTFPVRYTQPDIVIAGGKHTLPLSHPEQTAAAIEQFADCLSP